MFSYQKLSLQSDTIFYETCISVYIKLYNVKHFVFFRNVIYKLMSMGEKFSSTITYKSAEFNEES